MDGYSGGGSERSFDDTSQRKPLKRTSGPGRAERAIQKITHH